FYVNQATGADTLDSGRGESESKPFKTIQACLDYICSNYNIGTYDLTIHVAAGTYAECIVIPEINRTTGTLRLYGNSKTDTIIETKYNAPRQALTVTASSFARVDIRRFTIRALDSRVNPNGSNIYVDALDISQYAYVYMTDCILEGYQTETTDEIDLNRIRIVNSSGKIELNAPMTIKGIFSSTKSNKITGLITYTNGTIDIIGDTSTNIFEISGSFVFVSSTVGGKIARNTNSLPVITGEATGKRYYCTSGGAIAVAGGGEEYFPGSTAGTVQSETYSWYA
ncbi:pectinesterase family protein, partial [Desulfovibrio sp. An276]|uniref:pectinesterase family protein n=1 Tax=Desulfovibrio sp. An276 TaxID=1965618 RepID=UPI00194F0D46